MTIEEQIAEVLEDAEFNEVRVRAAIRHMGERLSQSKGRMRDEWQLMMEGHRNEWNTLIRDITGGSEEIVTHIEYEPLPQMFYEPKLPHEKHDPNKLYGEAAE